jgi:protein involved in polysaccharide export with SLBB domain
VTVNVTTMGERLVSVEGQVTKAGAYPVAPDTTLLSAISMAQSPTRIAKLDDTVIFRTVDGQRMAARFDLKRIRAGLDPIPRSSAAMSSWLASRRRSRSTVTCSRRRRSSTYLLASNFGGHVENSISAGLCRHAIQCSGAGRSRRGEL